MILDCILYDLRLCAICFSTVRYENLTSRGKRRVCRMVDIGGTGFLFTSCVGQKRHEARMILAHTFASFYCVWMILVG